MEKVILREENNHVYLENVREIEISSMHVISKFLPTFNISNKERPRMVFNCSIDKFRESLKELSIGEDEYLYKSIIYHRGVPVLPYQALRYFIHVLIDLSNGIILAKHVSKPKHDVVKKAELLEISFDLDDTLLMTRERFVDVYNDIYSKHPLFKQVYANDIDTWDLTKVCPLLTKEAMWGIFDHANFYTGIEATPLMYVYYKLHRESDSRGITLNIASKGSDGNIGHKEQMLYDEKDRIFGGYNPHKKQLFHMHNGMNKSEVKSFIFIDDNAEALLTSNATHKILYAPHGEKEWNKDAFKKDGVCTVSTAEELLNKIDFLLALKRLQ